MFTLGLHWNLEYLIVESGRNVLLQDMNVACILSHDHCQIEVVANGLPLWGGAQLVDDVALVSPVQRSGQPQPGSDREDGARLGESHRRKDCKHAELLRGHRCRLVVLLFLKSIVSLKPDATFHQKVSFRLSQMLLFIKNTERRTRRNANNSQNLPASRTKRTQG